MHWHNHRLEAVDVVRFRRPTKEVKDLFIDMFQKGHSPSSALQCHKFDLQVKHGSKFFVAHADGAQCPSIKCCYNQYY